MKRRKRQTGVSIVKLAAWTALAVLIAFALAGEAITTALDGVFGTTIASTTYSRLRLADLGTLFRSASSYETTPTIVPPEIPLPKFSQGPLWDDPHSPAVPRQSDVASLVAPAMASYGGAYANRYEGENTNEIGNRAAGFPTEAGIPVSETTPPELEAVAPMLELAGGSFFMGNDEGEYADQRPRHTVRLAPFEIDVHEVSNRQFRLFVEATGYKTAAERRGWSYVFDRKRSRWERKISACWFNTFGGSGDHAPRSADFERLLDHPVVHVNWDDAVAFCRWAGKRLPTEAEWEYAAKSGRIAPRYPWGERRVENGRFFANTWQGLFPKEDSGADGFLYTAPVGSYPRDSNRDSNVNRGLNSDPDPHLNGLHDLGGNVAEWCHDRYGADYYRSASRDNPTGPNRRDVEPVAAPLMQVVREEDGRYVVLHENEEEPVDPRTVRGGSFLSAENNGAAYRTCTRSWQPQTLSYQDLGFRAARSIRP